MDVATKDCTALGDSEIAEMADISAGGRAGLEVGLLSKLRDEWVLVTQARDEGELVGFAFSTLERIGGTPCLLVGVASFERAARSRSAMRSVLGDLYRRAVLAFPDEDVLVGARIAGPAGFEAYSGLADIVPRPSHKPTGEERAWGRRLAKRFGIEGHLDDRKSVVGGDGSPVPVLDYEPPDLEPGATGLSVLFEAVDQERRDTLVVFGWAMAEDLAEGSLPA